MTYKNESRTISNSLILWKSTRSGFKIYQLLRSIIATPNKYPTKYLKMNSHILILASSLLLSLVGVGFGASVGEKRDFGGYSGYEQQAAPSYAAPQVAAAQGYSAPQQPVYGPSPYTNPGFSVQTGFEGFLVPNTWYGLLPWGVEGVIVVIVGVIVFIVISVVILGLIAWLTGFGDYAIVKESARNLIPTNISFAALTDVTNTVLDALDKYDDLQVKKIN